jgi:hypothetical protein
MRRLLRENGLSIVTFGLFFVFLLMQSLTGWQTSNQERREHPGLPRATSATWAAAPSTSRLLLDRPENWYLVHPARLLPGLCAVGAAPVLPLFQRASRHGACRARSITR